MLTLLAGLIQVESAFCERRLGVDGFAVDRAAVKEKSVALYLLVQEVKVLDVFCGLERIFSQK
jgi:hypothetical protein